MATGRSTKLTGATGEFLVAAELCRRGLIAAPFAGNVPHYDLIASGQQGGHVPIQVKAMNGATWQFDISKYINISMHVDGKHQRLGKPLSEPFPGLVCVLVVLKGTGQDQFFILDWTDLRDILSREYRLYLKKHGFVRPRAPASFHTALPISAAEPFENRWETILEKVPRQPLLTPAAV